MRAFRLGRRTVDLDAALVTGDGAPEPLTPIEVRLLGFLAGRAGEVIARDELLVEVWGYRAGVQSRTIDSTCRRVRMKIEDDPSEPRHLVAAYGRGLCLRDVQGVAPLPADDAFVGRQAALAELTRLLRDGQRLIVVSGPAGVGKSRLVRELSSSMPTRSGWIACRTVRDAAGLEAAVVAALALDPGAPLPALGAAGPTLVALDGADDLRDAVAERVPAWLTAAPRLQVVVTSRVVLGLPGEQRFALGPLAIDEGVALLVDRAGRARPAAPPVDPVDAAELVASVDGLPLGIELLAARVHGSGVPALLAERGGSAELEAAVEGAWAALSADDRQALVAASVFDAPFTLHDLDGITGIGPTRALARLDALTGRSLVRVVRDAPIARYQPYGLVQERARREVDAPLRRRHAAWMARLGDPGFLAAAGADPARQDAIARSVHDLRAAMAFSEGDDPDVAARAGLALAWHARSVAADPSVAELLDRVWRLARAPRVKVWAALTASTLEPQVRPPDLVARLSAALSLTDSAHSDGDGDGAAVACQLGWALRRTGDLEGARAALAAATDRPSRPPPAIRASVLLLEACLRSPDPNAQDAGLVRAAMAEATAGGERRIAAGCAVWLSQRAYVGDGDWALGALWAERALGVWEPRDPLGVGPHEARERLLPLLSFAQLWRIRGGLDEAEARLEEAIAVADRSARVLAVRARLELARVWLRRGWYDDAADLVDRVIAAPTTPFDRTPGYAMLVAGLVALARGDDAAAEGWLRRAIAHGDPRLNAPMVAEAHLLLGMLTADPVHLAASAGLATGALSRALAHVVRAIALAARGDTDEAQRALEAGESAMRGLELLPDAEGFAWVRRAEQAIALRSGRVVVGPFGR